VSVITAATAIATDTTLTLTKIAILGFTRKMIMTRHLLRKVPMIRSRPWLLCVAASRIQLDFRQRLSVKAPFGLEIVLDFRERPQRSL